MGTSSATVMIVPARRSAQSAFWLNTSCSLHTPLSQRSSFQPRMSRWSATTTSSNQSPPLPSTRPKAGSCAVPPSSSAAAVPPFR